MEFLRHVPVWALTRNRLAKSVSTVAVSHAFCDDSRSAWLELQGHSIPGHSRGRRRDGVKVLQQSR